MDSRLFRLVNFWRLRRSIPFFQRSEKVDMNTEAVNPKAADRGKISRKKIFSAAGNSRYEHGRRQPGKGGMNTGLGDQENGAMNTRMGLQSGIVVWKRRTSAAVTMEVSP